nr:MAG TPA: hypothetical protein [Caudoviricetes sp.]
MWGSVNSYTERRKMERNYHKNVTDIFERK